MIRYLLSTEAGDVAVSLAVDAPHQRGQLAYAGPEEGAELVREWLEFECGAFGHELGATTTAIDLGHAMERQPGAKVFGPKRTHGDQLVAEYATGLGRAIS